MRKVVFLFLFLTVFLIKSVKAEVYINEFCPAGSPEWVELYNSGENEVDLANWYIDDVADKGSSPKKFSLVIPALSFSIVEVGSILNNTGGDSVRLLNSQQEEIDSYSYSENVKTTDYFTRCPDGVENWQIITASSPGQSNADSCPVISILPTLSLATTPSLSPTLYLTPTTQIPSPTLKQIQDYPNIYLNEIMPYPDNEGEWVELYNNNDYQVNLQNWYLDDQENIGSTPKIFSLVIEAKSYAVVSLTSHIFNNDEDTVRLLNSSQTEIDSLQYSQPPKGQSYSRQGINTDAAWCYSTASKNQANNPCPETSQTNTSSLSQNVSPTSKTKPSSVKSSITNSPKFNSPSGLTISSRFYSNKAKQILGASTTINKTPQIQFSFWLQYTKISLWVNLLLNLTLGIYLGLSSPALFRLLAG